MWKRGIVLAILLLSAFTTILVVYAASGGSQLCDSAAPGPIYLSLYSNGATTPNFVILPQAACGGVSENWYLFSNHVNFTSLTPGASTNPTQTFGVGVRYGNVTISSIGSSTITLTTAGTSTTVVTLYLPSGETVSQMADTYGTSSYTILQGAFELSNGTLPLPYVYWNQTANYWQIFTPDASLTFTLSGSSTTTTTTGGGGGGCCGVTTTTAALSTNFAVTNTTSTSTSQPQARTQNNFVTAVLLFVVVFAAITFPTIQRIKQKNKKKKTVNTRDAYKKK